MTASILTAFNGRFFFFQAEDGIRDLTVTGVQTCALPISRGARRLRQALCRWAHDGEGATRPVLRSVAHAHCGWAGGLRLDSREGDRHPGEICEQPADTRRLHQDLRRWGA